MFAVSGFESPGFQCPLHPRTPPHKTLNLREGEREAAPVLFFPTISECSPLQFTLWTFIGARHYNQGLWVFPIISLSFFARLRSPGRPESFPTSTRPLTPSFRLSFSVHMREYCVTSFLFLYPSLFSWEVDANILFTFCCPGEDCPSYPSDIQHEISPVFGLPRCYPQ